MSRIRLVLKIIKYVFAVLFAILVISIGVIACIIAISVTDLTGDGVETLLRIILLAMGSAVLFLVFSFLGYISGDKES
jgi:hypothetical protein